MIRLHLYTILATLLLTACATPTPGIAPTTDEGGSKTLDEGPPKDEFNGHIDALDIARALKSREDQISACYAAQRALDPAAEGLVLVQFTITPSEAGGIVTEALPIVDEVGGNTGECLAEQVRNLQGLPAPVGAPYRAALPFRFKLE